MSSFKVMDRRCDQCLYGKDKVVSDKARKQILREITRKDCGFICHKSSTGKEKVYCRGDFDARACGKLGRIMKWLGGMEFVSADEFERRFKEHIT